MALTAIQCEKIKPESKAIKKSDGSGLYLQVNPNGSKLWRLAYRFDGKQKTLAIGQYSNTLGLKEARQARDAAKDLLEQGIDPSQSKQQAKHKIQEQQSITIEFVAIEWIEYMKHRWSEVHADDVRRSLDRHVLPTIGKYPIAHLEYSTLTALLERLTKTGALETVKRCRQRLEKIFDYGISRGYCEKNLAIPLKGLLQPPKVTNMAALPIEEFPAFLNAIKRYNANTLTKLALELMMHTFVRTGELIGAKWAEFDFDTQLWNIPSERMKMKRPHVVPLSEQVIAILHELKDITGHREYLFPNRNNPRKSMSDSTIIRLIDRIGYKGRMTGHGFRSVASTMLNESGEWRSEVIEHQLAHVERNEVRGAYNRAQYIEERTEMMQWYSDSIESIQQSNIRLIRRSI